MAQTTNNLQLVVEVDSAGAIQNITATNQAFSGLEQSAVRAGQNAATGIDKITVSMASAVTQGNLLAGALERVGSWIKQATVDAALYAAKIDQLQIGLKAVTVANGANAAVVNSQVDAVKRMGVSTQDATLAVTKLMAAGADYTKTADFMRVALQLVHTTGMDTTEAIDGLSRAVITGYERTLRAAGINVNFAESYQKLAAQTGRTVEQLGEMEKLQARMNALQEYGARLGKAYEDSQGGAAESLRLLKVNALAAEEAVGGKLQDDLKNVLGILDRLAAFATDHAEGIANLVRVLGELAVALAALKSLQWIVALLPRLATLAEAATGPWGLLTAGIIAATAALIGFHTEANKVSSKELTSDAYNTAVKMLKENGGLTDAQARDKADQQFGLGKYDKAAASESARINAENALKDKQEQAAKDAIEAAKKLAKERETVEADAAKTLSEIGKQAWNKYYHDVEAVFQKIEQAIQKHALTIKGKVDYMRALLGSTVTSKAPSGTVAFGDIDVSGATLTQHTPGMLQIAQQQEMAAAVNAQDEVRIRQRDLQIKATEEANNYNSEVLKAANAAVDKRYDYEQQKLDESHTLELKALDEVNAQTVKQKLWVEQQKFAIEQEYLKKSEQLQLDRLSLNALQQRTEAIGTAQDLITKGANPDQVNATLNQQLGDIGDQLDLAQQSVKGKISTQQQESADTAVKAQTKVYQDQYKSVYDTILKQTDNFLQTIEDKTTSAWKRIADNLKKTFESVLNNFIASKFAGMLTYLITGQEPNGAMGKKGGLIMGAPGGMMSSGAGLALAASGYGSGGGFTGAGFGGGVGGGSSSPGGFLQRLFGGGSSGGSGSFSGPSGGGSFPVPDMGAGGVMSDMASGNNLGAQALAISGYGSGGGFTGSSGNNPATNINGLGSIFSGKGLSGILGNLKNGGWIKAIGPLAMMAGSSMLLQGAFNPIMAGTTSGTVNTVAGAGLSGYGIGSQFGGPFGGLEGALIGTGAGMVVNGSERGNLTGTLESTGGGLLAGSQIGFMAGGPIGSLIGGAIGAGVGLISGIMGMLFGTTTDKIKKQVKAAYGITIGTDVAQAIYKIAQQSYGGSIALAISSAQVRQMLALYADATAQQGNANAISPHMTPYTVADAGGGLTSLPSTYDGVSVGSQMGGILPQGNIGTMPSGGGLGMASGSLNIQLNGPATTALLQGQVASYAPSAVQNASSSTMNGNSLGARVFQPGLITR